MEKVKLDWSTMTADSFITVWMKPGDQTDTAGDRRVTNEEWCVDELKRIQKKGKNAELVIDDRKGLIALRRK